VPIDLLKTVLDDLRKFGRVNKAARPGLGDVHDRDRQPEQCDREFPGRADGGAEPSRPATSILP